MISEETVAELKDAGFFRAFQRKGYRGLESHPLDFFGAVVEIAAACPSTAWILAIMGIHQFELAQLSEELQDEILGRNPDTLIASSYAAQGQVTRVPGGYRLSGRWRSSSGVDHAGWVVLGGMAPPQNGAGQPSHFVFHVPLRDAQLLDDWYVMGLAGTGSKSVVLDEVFVPEHRANARRMPAPPSPDGSLDPVPLFRLPQGLMYLLPGAAPAVGAAKGALAEYTKQVVARTRRRLDGTLPIQDPFLQRRLAEAKYRVECAEDRMMTDMVEMMTSVETDGHLSADALARYSWDFSRPGDDCASAVRSVFETLGASVIYASNPLQRYYRDLLTMRQHGTQDPDRGALTVARRELGLSEAIPGPPPVV